MNPSERGPVPEFEAPPRRRVSPWGLGGALAGCGLVLAAGPWMPRPSAASHGSRDLRPHNRRVVALRFDEGTPSTLATLEAQRGAARPATGLGRNQPSGGGYGTGTVDPRLLTLKAVLPAFSDPEASLPAGLPDRALSFAGDPQLPQAAGGDGSPAGRGNGYGWGTGPGLGNRGGPGGGAAAQPAPRVRPVTWGILRKVPARYPYQARVQQVEGYVVVLVTVDAAGRPIALLPVSGSALLLPECLRVLKRWLFVPPGSYGLEAPATFPVTYLFRLEEAPAGG